MSVHNHNTTGHSIYTVHAECLDTYKKIRGVEFTRGLDRQHIADIQKAFIRETLQRFENLRGAIRAKVGYEGDFFGLKQDAAPRTNETARQRFLNWLRNAYRVILGLNKPERELERGEHFSGQFIEGAAIQGFNQGTGQLFQAGISNLNNPDDERVRELVQEQLRPPNGRYIAPVNEFEGITQDMARKINQRLDEGFTKGWNPQKMATKINEDVKSLERSRAATIARTETAFTHSQQSLRRYREAGVEGVSHAGRMVTPDESLCPWCRAIRDTVFTLEEFSGTRVRWRGQEWFVGVPAHPNGRCAPVPKPGVDELPPIEERLPDGAEVIASGFDMFSPGAVG